MGLRTVVDLRTAERADRAGQLPGRVGAGRLPPLPGAPADLGGPDPRRHDVDGAEFLTARYAEMLIQGAEAIAGALTVLADPRVYPAVFHCAAGKDRTGVLAALVLGLVGVPDETIAADYGLSRVGMAAMVEWIRVNRPEVADTHGRPARRPAGGTAPRHAGTARPGPGRARLDRGLRLSIGLSGADHRRSALHPARLTGAVARSGRGPGSGRGDAALGHVGEPAHQHGPAARRC